jgi:hypothetical protein
MLASLTISVLEPGIGLEIGMNNERKEYLLYERK